MKVIFLTLSRIRDIRSRGIYADLMRKFRNEGHDVYIITPNERQYRLSTSLKEVDGVHIVGVRTLNLQKTNAIEKGIGTVLLERQYIKAINRYLGNLSFDLILYSTPPITFTNVVKQLKKKNPRSISYLLLKDIFPQNAVDLRMFSKYSPIYFYFRYKEKTLYKRSDYIGCMSPANVRFILEHNRFLSTERVEVAPNSLELPESGTIIDSISVRKHYGLPIDKPVFIYGGNLGKPQGVNFLIACLDANKERKDCHFLIVGNGTEFRKLKKWFDITEPHNVSLFSRLPKEEYDCLVQSCDVGLIFLDYRFLIPNYPSRLLSYLEYKMPVIAATDRHTDIGEIAEANGYGFWCESISVTDFTECINTFTDRPELIKDMGEKGYYFLINNYLVDNTYRKILSHINPGNIDV